MKKLGLLILTIFLIATTFAWAAPTTDTATISWTPPSTNTDGSPLTDLGGYKVYHRTGPTYDTPGVDVGNMTSHQITGLLEATHYFVITAYDVVGNESVYSNEVIRTINFTRLNPPGDVVVGP